MIIFDLSCSANHRFEGWFRSADDFGEQQARGLVSCPHCGSAEVRRVPSAVHVAALKKVPAAPMVQSPQAPPTPMAALKAIVDRMLANAENVGKSFPEEARRIHYHEAPERPICGEASEDDCAALEDEGIEIVRLPDIKPKNLN